MKDYLAHYGVIGMKWGQRRSRVYAQKSDKASAKGNSEKAAQYKAKSQKIKKYHQDMGGKSTYDRVAKTKTGKAIAQSMIFGTYGALKYNEARGKGKKRGEAAVNGILYGLGDAATGNIARIVEPRLRKKNKGKTVVSKEYLQKVNKG